MVILQVGVLKSAGKNITLYLAKLEPKPEGDWKPTLPSACSPVSTMYTFKYCDCTAGERQAEGGERMWLAFTEVPLLLASVTQFHRGTAILRYVPAPHVGDRCTSTFAQHFGGAWSWGRRCNCHVLAGVARCTA